MFLVVLATALACVGGLMVKHRQTPASATAGLGDAGSIEHGDVAYYLHVPGVAGPFFAEDTLRKYSVLEVSGEGCFNEIPQKLGVLGTILMFKKPRHHVAALYDACRSPAAKAQRERSRPQGSPDLPETFAEWVHQWRLMQDDRFKGNPNPLPPRNTSHNSLDSAEHGLSLYADFPYQCYTPVNLQVQRLLCHQPLDWRFDSDFFRSFEPLQLAFSIGLAEYPQASACIIELKLLFHYGGDFPPYCNRSNDVAWQTFPGKEKPAQGATDVESLPEDVLQEVDILTYGDNMLYHWSVAIFLTHTRLLEAAFGTLLLSAGERSQLAAIALEQ